MLQGVACVWPAPTQHLSTRFNNVARCCVEMLLEFCWLNSSCYFYFKFVIFQVPEEKLFQILFELHLYTHSFTFFAIPQ